MMLGRLRADPVADSIWHGSLDSIAAMELDEQWPTTHIETRCIGALRPDWGCPWPTSRRACLPPTGAGGVGFQVTLFVNMLPSPPINGHPPTPPSAVVPFDNKQSAQSVCTARGLVCPPGLVHKCTKCTLWVNCTKWHYVSYVSTSLTRNGSSAEAKSREAGHAV